MKRLQRRQGEAMHDYNDAYKKNRKDHSRRTLPGYQREASIESIIPGGEHSLHPRGKK